jgi:hypothetical protein
MIIKCLRIQLWNSAGVSEGELWTPVRMAYAPAKIRTGYASYWVTCATAWDYICGCVALGYELDDRGFKSQQGLGIFLCTSTSRLALGPTQPPIHWVPGALSLRIKWLECEADLSPPSSAKIKNAWSYISTPPVCLHGMVLNESIWFKLFTVFSNCMFL